MLVHESCEEPNTIMSLDPAIAIVRRNTEEVQGRGNFDVFEELFAFDFVDHTPQPGGFTADRDGARNLYRVLRATFPDFHAEIHWQISDGDRVTTFKTTAHTRECSGDLSPPGARSILKPWMSSAFATAKSLIIGASQTSSLLHSSSASGRSSNDVY